MRRPLRAKRADLRIARLPVAYRAERHRAGGVLDHEARRAGSLVIARADKAPFRAERRHLRVLHLSIHHVAHVNGAGCILDQELILAIAEEIAGSLERPFWTQRATCVYCA